MSVSFLPAPEYRVDQVSTCGSQRHYRIKHQHGTLPPLLYILTSNLRCGTVDSATSPRALPALYWSEDLKCRLLLHMTVPDALAVCQREWELPVRPKPEGKAMDRRFLSNAPDGCAPGKAPSGQRLAVVGHASQRAFYHNSSLCARFLDSMDYPPPKYRSAPRNVKEVYRSARSKTGRKR